MVLVTEGPGTKCLLKLDWMFVTFLNEKTISLILQYGILEELVTFIIQIYFQVKSVRNHTKAEKKKLAMAMRAKQLKAIGLQANEHGQVKADNSLLQQFVGLAEESGLCCSICREGYKFQPNKVKLS